LAYFIFVATVLYPLHEHLHFDVSGISIAWLKNLLKPIGSWVFSLLYLLAELWGSAIIGLMFWRFANDVTSM
jgi:AAA family ATP:ADP antiporter